MFPHWASVPSAVPLHWVGLRPHRPERSFISKSAPKTLSLAPTTGCSLPHRQDTNFKKRAKGADFGAKPATARQGRGKAARGTGTECGQDIPVERQAKRTSIDDSPSILNPRSFLLAQAPSLCLRLACQRPCRSLEPSSSGPTWCKKLGFGEPCFAMVKPTNKRILKNTESTVH